MSITITNKELKARLTDPEAADDEVLKYYEAVQDSPFTIRYRLRPEVTIVFEPGEQEAETFGSAAISVANGFMRMKRHRRFNKMLNENPARRVYVSEGDSWFQHPLVEETIDHLMKTHDLAIWSLDGAAHTLQEMVDQNEFAGAMQEKNSDVLLFSGGGNDLMGDHFGDYLNNFTPGAPGTNPARFLNATFGTALNQLFVHYRAIIQKVKQARPNGRMYVHCYDFVRPRTGSEGKWLGGPLEDHGISHQADKDGVIREIISQFKNGLQHIADGSGGVMKLVDTTGTVPAGQWHDEIHANDSGYAPVAAKWKTVLSATNLA